MFRKRKEAEPSGGGDAAPTPGGRRRPLVAARRAAEPPQRPVPQPAEPAAVAAAPPPPPAPAATPADDYTNDLRAAAQVIKPILLERFGGLNLSALPPEVLSEQVAATAEEVIQAAGLELSDDEKQAIVNELTSDLLGPEASNSDTAPATEPPTPESAQSANELAEKSAADAQAAKLQMPCEPSDVDAKKSKNNGSTSRSSVANAKASVQP